MQQIVTPRRGQAVVGGRGRVAGLPQRPARRDRPVASQVKSKTDLRSMIGYLPWIGRIVLLLVLGLSLFAGYRAAASAKFFEIKSIDVTGTSRVSSDEVRAVVQHTAAGGVWTADVTTLRAELEQMPWVRSAVVSRVLPDGIRIRITERVPYAIVHADNGKLVWVDQDAVILGPMSLQRDQIPPFFIRGWSSGWGPQTDNRARLALYQTLLATWQAQGLADKISELDLTNIKNPQVSLSGNYSHVTVKLLTPDYGEGLHRALERLGAASNAAQVTVVTVMPNRTILDVARGDNESDGDAESDGEPAADSTESGTPADDDTGHTPVRRSPVSEPVGKPTRVSGERSQNDREPRRGATKPAPDKKPAAAKPKTETRPRRAK